MIDSRNGSNDWQRVATYIETETAGKLEGEMHVGIVRAMVLWRVMHKDWKELVACYGMKGQEGIDYQIDVRLARENFSIAWRRLRRSVMAVLTLVVLDDGR